MCAPHTPHSATPLLGIETRQSKASLRHIDALKLWYLCYFSAQFMQLFLPLVLQQVMSFTPTTIGILMSLRRFVIFFAAPLFAMLCDATYLHRQLLIFAHTAYYFCTFLLTRFRSIAAVTIVIIFREAFVAGCEPALNTAAFAKLAQVYGPLTSASRFGKVRLWGSVGWGFTSLLIPVICDKLFAGSLVPMLYAQIILGLPVIALLCYGLDLSPNLFTQSQEKHAAASHHHHYELGQTATSPNTPSSHSRSTAYGASYRLAFLCLLAAFEQGIVLGATQTTLLIYFSDIGVTSTVIGLSVLVGCFSEAFMYSTDRLLRRFISNDKRVIQFAILVNSFALMNYTLLRYIPKDGIWRLGAVLGTEFIGGASYALFVCSVLQMADRVAPPEWQTGSQGIVTSIMYGIGPAVGAMFGGWAFAVFGIKAVYGTLVMLNMFTILILGV